MGPKRAKTKVTVEPNSNDEVAEILVEILDESGVFRKNSDQVDAWDMLSSAIGELVKNLEKVNSEKVYSNEATNSQCHLLLKVEEAAHEVRSRARNLSNDMKYVPQELLLLCHELESICPKLRPLARSLRGAVCQQRWIANDVICSIWESLSKLYVGIDKQIDAIVNLRESALCISLRCIRPEKSPWRDAKKILEKSIQSDLERSELTPAKHESSANAGADSKELTALDDAKPCQIKTNPILMDQTIMETVKTFAFDSESPSIKKFFSILIVGAEGSGKTFCCNEIEKIVDEKVDVIRPSLPFDMMGQTVGATEDLLIAIISSAICSSKPSILILDDIETIFGYQYATSTNSMTNYSDSGGSREPHVTARARALLFSLFDNLRMKEMNGSRTLLICTSKVNFGKSIDRFDATYILSNPNESMRRVIISRHIEIETLADDQSKSMETMLSNLVECTSGLSYAELAQHCMRAVLYNYESNIPRSNEEVSVGFMKTLKQQIQESTPESLRSGLNTDFVGMRVMSSRDLQEMSKNTSGDKMISPLFGKSAMKAWQDLLRTIVMPICQVGALENLLHKHGGASGRVFAGGVVLTGDPGCGKSALAYHAATVAASMNPLVKLVDVSCTSLISKEVGSSERSIHRLFEAARAAAPCIMLMDGIETIACVRGNDNTTEGTMDRVLSTLLTELDGIDSENVSQENPACLAIIGITHNYNWIDPALRRPGRLGKVIEMGRPEHEARRSIVLRELAGSSYAHDSTTILNDYLDPVESLAEHVATETKGFTAAGLIAVCNDAKMLSSKAWYEDSLGQDVKLQTIHILDAVESRRAAER